MIQLAVVAVGALALAIRWHRFRNDRWATFLVGGYAYPLLLLTAFGSDELAPTGLVLPPDVAETGRIAVVALILAIGVLRLLTAPPARVAPSGVFIYVAVLGMSISALVNPGPVDDIARIVLTIAVVANLFVIVPSVAGDDLHRWFEGLRGAATIVAVTLIALSVTTVAMYGSGTGSLRLGRPLSPGLLSWLLTLTLVLHLLTGTTARMWKGTLFTAIVLTASRTGLAGAAGLVLVEAVSVRQLRGRRLVALAVVAAAAGGFYFVHVEERLVDVRTPWERSAFDSGRSRLWAEATQQLAEQPWTGTGTRVEVDNLRNDDASRVHNMVIETSVSYGVPVATAAVAVYAALWWAVAGVRGRFRWVLIGLAALAAARTAVTTTSWLNLADGTNVLLLAVLVPAAWTGRKVRRDLRATRAAGTGSGAEVGAVRRPASHTPTR